MEDKQNYCTKLSFGDLCLSILNGVIGNFLSEKKNELEIEMGFYLNRKLIPVSEKSILELTPNPTSKICIMLHGLVCNEEFWNFPVNSDDTFIENYGTLLQKDYGYTALFLRYNTGLHVSQNGKKFSELMNTLVSVYPKSIEKIIIIGHSMGGMVARSACYYAELKNYFWQKKIAHIFYMGSPHLGSYLEKIGNTISSTLRTINNPITKLLSDIANIRSDGIKDMRFGNLIDEDWMGYDPDAFMQNNRNCVPLLKNAKHHIFIGAIADDIKHPINKTFGDAIVRINSASRGQNSEHIKIFPGIKHLTLMHHPGVYKEIKTLCENK